MLTTATKSLTKNAIYSCKRCKVLFRRSYDVTVEIRPQGKDRFGIERNIKIESWHFQDSLGRPRMARSAPMIECACGREMYGRTIEGRVKPSVRCDARCEGATGHQCECSCGGKNHGSAHQG